MKKLLWSIVLILAWFVAWSTQPAQAYQNLCLARAIVPTYAEGESVPCTLKLDGGQGVHWLDQLSGEDPAATGGGSTTGVLVVEKRYVSSGLKTADFQAKASAGFVHNMVCIGTDVAATAGTIILYDSLTETGTQVVNWDVQAINYSAPVIFPVDVSFTTGIFLGFTTTADVRCYVTYR